MSWDVPNYRIRAYVRGLRTVATKKRRLLEMPFHMRRVSGLIKVTDGAALAPDLVPARLILNDLTPKGARIFTSYPLMPGQQIQLTLEHPEYFYVRAQVVHCAQVSVSNKILSPQSFHHRIEIRFTFESDLEILRVRNYCQDIYKRYVLRS